MLDAPVAGITQQGNKSRYICIPSQLNWGSSTRWIQQLIEVTSDRRSVVEDFWTTSTAVVICGSQSSECPAGISPGRLGYRTGFGKDPAQPSSRFAQLGVQDTALTRAASSRRSASSQLQLGQVGLSRSSGCFHTRCTSLETTDALDLPSYPCVLSEFVVSWSVILMKKNDRNLLTGKS